MYVYDYIYIYIYGWRYVLIEWSYFSCGLRTIYIYIYIYNSVFRPQLK